MLVLVSGSLHQSRDPVFLLLLTSNAETGEFGIFAAGNGNNTDMIHKRAFNKGRQWRMTAGIALVILFYACAHVVSPTGGPRDEEPPKVVRSTPPNFSANFDGDEIRIFFDEFVELRNIRQQLLVSPPLETMPEVRIRGRSIVMEIEEELMPNTTYNFFFGDAIRDITEGNAIPNFQFVVSTGDHVDSLSMGGQVLNAYNLKPEEGVYVMLYDSIYDSIPYLERPVYLAKTDEDGLFDISNMAGGEYLMFALDDQNYNFKYDLPDERIGFLDSIVSPQYVKTPVDTLPVEDEETPAEPGDTLMPHAADIHGQAHDEPVRSMHSGPSYTLYLFQEEDTVQRVTTSALTRKGLITIGFRIPFDSAYVREVREPFDDEGWHIPEIGEDRDTLRIWFADTGRDSLFLEVRDGDQVLDTVRRATVPRRRARDREDGEEDQHLQISATFRRPSAVPFHQPLQLTSAHPIEKKDSSRIELLIHDSIPIPASFHFTDHVRRKLKMHPPLEEETAYRLQVLPGAFTDIFGLTNDTLMYAISTTSRENYGNVILDLEMPPATHQRILQLLNMDEEVIQKKLISQSGRHVFEYVRPGRYLLRLVDDLDESGAWTTGNYLQNRQPEPVHMLPDTIRVRENWDVEMPWTITPR